MKIKIINGIDTWELDTANIPPEAKDVIETHAEEIIKIVNDLIYHSGTETKTEIKLKEEKNMKPEYVNPTRYESGHMQIIGKCGTFGHEAIRKEILYDEIRKVCGELIKLGNHEKKKPKFGIGDTVETIQEYETECCPYENGVITAIDYNYSSIVYLIGDTWIYEKWLRKVE